MKPWDFPDKPASLGFGGDPNILYLRGRNEFALAPRFCSAKRLYGVFTPPGLAGQKDSQILFLQLSLLSQSLHLIGKAPQGDEALGVLLVVVALLKGDQILGVQGAGG